MHCFFVKVVWIYCYIPILIALYVCEIVEKELHPSSYHVLKFLNVNIELSELDF